MMPVHPARHLLRAKDLVDARYREALDVPTLARAARLSPSHFSREFRRAFGEPPHKYLLMRRLERAAALLRNTDRTVPDICLTVGLCLARPLRHQEAPHAELLEAFPPEARSAVSRCVRGFSSNEDAREAGSLLISRTGGSARGPSG
jgi:transcriptional regulator GlxA family with amidase domain